MIPHSKQKTYIKQLSLDLILAVYWSLEIQSDTEETSPPFNSGEMSVWILDLDYYYLSSVCKAGTRKHKEPVSCFDRSCFSEKVKKSMAVCEASRTRMNVALQKWI